MKEDEYDLSEWLSGKYDLKPYEGSKPQPDPPIESRKICLKIAGCRMKRRKLFNSYCLKNGFCDYQSIASNGK